MAKYPDQANYDAGTVVRLVPRPDVGYSFRNWSGDVSSKALVGRVTMTGNKSVTANFGAWVAPLGTPDPNWGLTQTYRMYDNPASRNGTLTYTQNAEGGYYTHYIDNTDPNATDSSTQSGITDPFELSNHGTVAKPRKTVPVNYPDGSVVEGSVFEVHGGPYTYAMGGGEVIFSGLGSAAKPIFIRGSSATTRPIFTHGCDIGLDPNGYLAHHIVVENLDFYNSVDEGDMYLAVEPPSHHVAIRNCDVHGVHCTHGAGIYVDYGLTYPNARCSYVLIYACSVHDYGHLDESTDEDKICMAAGQSSYVWIVDNHLYNATGSIVLNAWNSANDTYAQYLHHYYVGRNVIHDFLQTGPWVKCGQDIIYSQNDVYHGLHSPNDPGGEIGISCGFGWQYTPKRVWYLFNRFQDITGAGCYTGSTQYSDNLYVIGNVMAHVSDRAVSLGLSDPNVFFVNNTIYDFNDGFNAQVMANNVRLENNILVKRRDPAKYNVYVDYDTSKTTLTNNIIYQPSGSVRIGWGGASPVYTVAQLQAADPRQTGNLEQDPLFSDAEANDYSLASNSPAIDAGTESTVYDTFYNRYGIDIKKDINGNSRTGTWDIGAYEYTLSAIMNLSILGTSQNSVTLNWTVPGEERVTGTPTRYDIRYAGSSLTEVNWDTATQVQGEPVPGGFGAQQSFTITGLNPGATYYIAIKVGDEAGHFSRLSNVISPTTATSGNQAPVLQSIGDRSVAEGAMLTFVISAMDADGDALTYSATGLATGASFTPGTRTFTWTPATSQRGTHHVTFQVSDGQVTVSETITITVRETADHAPVLGAIGDKSVNENALLSFSVSATDSDGDSLTFSATGLPSGATLVDGAFNWTPNYSQAGSYQITFTVSDGELTDSEQITITVANVTDQTAPVADEVFPAPDAFQVPVNPVIALALSSAGLGVDANTVAIRVGDQLVYTGNSILYNSPDGICRRTGNPMNYRYYFFPNDPFDFDQPVSVLVNASDLAHNAMTPLSYQFVTEMRSFGQNQLVSSNVGNSGHPAIATDSHGNIWAAWHTGQAGACDIYVAKRGADAQQWAAPLRLTNLDSDQRNPVIAIGSNDTIYVAWQGNRRGNWDIYAGISLDGTTWQDPVRVTDPNTNETNPAIAIDHASPNRVYIAWQQDDASGNQDIYVASSSTRFISKAVTQVTSQPADQTEPALAVGSDNAVYIVWTDQRNGTADIYGSSSSTSSWSNVPIATGPGNQRSPAIAVEPGTSSLYVLWVSDTAGNSDIVCGISNGLAAAPISGSVVVDDATGADQSAPAILAVKDHWNRSHIYACWQDNRSVADSGDSDLYFAEIRSGTGGTNVLVGDDGANSNQSDPVLGFDRYGEPVVLWVDDRNNTAQIYSACSTYPDSVALVSGTIPSLTGGRVGPDPASIRDDSDISIGIPSNALGCDAPLAISEMQNTQAFGSPCLASYEISPSGIQFSAPATVVIPYMASGSGPAIPYWYDAQTGMLSQLGITDITRATLPNGLSVVSFQTTHLTPFYVLQGSSGGGVGGGSNFGGGGCALSRSHEGSIVGYFLPYGALVLLLFVRRWMGRRHKRDSERASAS